MLGVSSMTVHRAIAGKPDIAPRTRTRIMAEVKRLGWRPNMAARGLRVGKSHTLGVLVSNVSASFLPEILQGIDAAAEERGYHSLVCVHEHEPARATTHLRTLQSKGVDGIILYPTTEGKEVGLLNTLVRTVPLAAVMRRPTGFSGASVCVDDEAGGRLAAEHLLSLGHRHLAILHYDEHALSGERRRGFGLSVDAAGVPAPAERSVPLRDDAAARAAVRSLLDAASRPTAVFCVSDRLAALALQTAVELGLAVPRDLSIVGYNGEDWGCLLSPPLTSVEQPRRQIGEQAARLVLGDPPEAGAPPGPELRLPPGLIVRGSTGPP